MNCPRCGRGSLRVIFMGAPVWLCPDDGCGTAHGFWSWLLLAFPAAFSGALLSYESSPWGAAYLRALWFWLNGDGGAGGSYDA